MHPWRSCRVCVCDAAEYRPKLLQQRIKAADNAASGSKTEVMYQIVSNLPYFAHLSKEDLTSVAMVASYKEFETGAVRVLWHRCRVLPRTPASLLLLCVRQTIIAPGSSSSYFYVVSSGVVQVSVDGRAVALLNDHSHFGELEVLLGCRRVVSVTAMEKTSVVEVPKLTYTNQSGCDEHRAFVTFLRSLPGFTEVPPRDVARLYYSAGLATFRVRDCPTFALRALAGSVVARTALRAPTRSVCRRVVPCAGTRRVAMWRVDPRASHAACLRCRGGAIWCVRASSAHTSSSSSTERRRCRGTSSRLTTRTRRGQGRRARTRTSARRWRRRCSDSECFSAGSPSCACTTPRSLSTSRPWRE
jgi:hypothetical protein